MSCSSRDPGRIRNESSLLQQKPGPQFSFFDKTPVISERASDPTTIGDKILVLAFFFLPIPSPSRSRSVRPTFATKAWSAVFLL
jgi:hypothetical protein